MNPFGITKEEILDLAAQKLVDEFCNEEDLSGKVDKMVGDLVTKTVASRLSLTVDAFIQKELERLITSEVTPVDIWGEPTGKPTTIRGVLTVRAANFWGEKVDADGKLSTSTWGNSKTRAEWLMAKVAAEEFAGAVKQNLVNIIGALKDHMREDYKGQVDTYLNELIKVKTAGDKK